MTVKSLGASLLALWLVLPSGAQAATDVYLLAGQSNMAGRGELTPSNRLDLSGVMMLNASNVWVAAAEPIHFDKPWCAGAGLAASFAADRRAADRSVTVGLVPCAMGGTPIAKWMPPDAVYFTNAVQRTRAALKSSGGRLRAILWHQGEGDCSKKGLAVYPERLKALVAALRQEFGKDVPFVAGELQQGRSWYDEYNRLLHETIREIPNAVWVSSEGLTAKSDRVHFNTPSLRTFGHRYAEGLRRLEGEMSKKK